MDVRCSHCGTRFKSKLIHAVNSTVTIENSFETCPNWWCGRKVRLDGNYSFDSHGKATLLDKISGLGLKNEELKELKNLAISAINSDISHSEFKKAVAESYRDLANVFPIMTYSVQIKFFYVLILAICLYLIIKSSDSELATRQLEDLPKIQDIETQHIDSLFRDFEKLELDKKQSI